MCDFGPGRAPPAVRQPDGTFYVEHACGEHPEGFMTTEEQERYFAARRAEEDRRLIFCLQLFAAFHPQGGFTELA